MTQSSASTSSRYLVTGASGELGTVLVEHLIAKGAAVRVLVRSTEKGAPLAKLGAEVAIGDLTNEASLERACTGITGVYHLGAIYRAAGLPDEAYYDVNSAGARRIFEAAIRAGVSRIIHCSTGGVLGDIKNPPGSHQSPYNPGDVYQRSKTEGEKIALDFYKRGLIAGVVIRPAMVWGPGDTRHLKLFRMIAKGRFFYVGAGMKSVHFIDIRDLARAFELAMEHTERNGEIYHIANEGPLPLRDAVNMVADQLNVARPWLHLPVVPVQLLGSLCELICAPFGISPPIYRRRVDFFTKSRHFDTSKAKREIGFSPSRNFHDELVDIVTTLQGRGLLPPSENRAEGQPRAANMY